MIERYPGKAAVCAAFLFVFLLVQPAAEAAISVSPVRVDLHESRDKDVIQVSNHENHRKSYQVEVVSWSQAEDRPEVYSPTEALLVVPPLFTLEPGENQVLRVGMLEEPDASIEQTYRVFITEIASPQAEAPEATGVTMRLQIGVPIFVAPKAPAVATLDLVDTRSVDGKLFLRFRNSGNVHIKVSEIVYEPPGLEEPAVSPAATYIHAGQTGTLPVPSPGGRPVGKVTLVTDSLGTLEYELPGTP